MARPVNANAAATRRRILDGAAYLFSEQGVGQTSVRRIAREAGVSLAMIHHYFGSKEQLYTACVQAMFDELREFSDVIAPVARDAATAGLQETTRRLVHSGFQFSIEHQEALRLLTRSVLDMGTIGHEWRAEHVATLERFSNLASAVLGRRPDDIRLHLWSVVNLMVRYALTSVEELAAAAGLPIDASPDAVYGHFEDHLFAVASAVLLTPATS